MIKVVALLVIRVGKYQFLVKRSTIIIRFYFINSATLSITIAIVLCYFYSKSLIYNSFISGMYSFQIYLTLTRGFKIN